MGLFSRKKIEPEVVEVEESSEVTKEHGPWEASEVDSNDDRLDFGAIRVPKVKGMGIKFTIDPRSREAMGLLLHHGASQMEVHLYAAPSSSDLWPDVRDEILEGAKSNGGTATLREGPFGPEVEARIPHPELQEERHVRYVGVDGYRWMLRLIIEGQAVTNPEEREVFDNIIRDLVIDRGTEPHPVRDLIYLTMNSEARERLEEKLGKPKRPERGPEIAEIR